MFKDRSKAPQISELLNIEILQPLVHTTPAGLPIHVIGNVANDVFHVQIELEGGKVHQKKPLESAFAGELLLSGTSEYNQSQIQEYLDILGAFVQIEVGLMNTIIHVYGLIEHFEKIFDFLHHVLAHANYPQREFELHVKAAKQQHLVNMEKNNFFARRVFLKALFPNHTIGIVPQLEDFDEINRYDVLNFFSEYYSKNVRQIHVVGNIRDKHLLFLEKLFDFRYTSRTPSDEVPCPVAPENIFIDKPNSLQSSILIGRILFTPKHPDFFEFDILETILGGYFGSRLMQNLREDKGYTYGVGCGLSFYEHTGYFSISTEVGKEHKFAAMDAIKHEILRLQNELIPDDELALARSYLQGQVLKSTDGAFAQMNQFLFSKRFNLPINYANQFLETLANIRPERLRALAQCYLDWDQMTKVIVG
jgi:predicted Zn-dependent peptidase